MVEIDAKYQLKDFPRLFGEWMAWFVGVGILSYLSVSAVGLLIMLGIFGYLALYKPKLFVKAMIMYLMITKMFTLESIYSGWGEHGGHGQGNLLLGFLRRVPPSSPGPSNLYRVFFIAMLAVLFPRWWRSPNRFEFNKFESLLLLFIIFWGLSCVANLEFGKLSLRFIMQFTLPFYLFLFMQNLRYSPSETSSTFGIIMFAGVEMQVFISLVQNFQKLPGKFFFNDYAVGTFVFPLYERSAYFLAIGFLFFLYKFLITRQTVYILRMVIALYGIMSISVILFTVVFGGVVAISIFYAFTLKIIKGKEMALALILMLSLSYPIYLIFTDDSLASDSSRHTEKMLEKNEAREWWEIPKIYSFVNLYNMMTEEKRLIFGSGPGTFLTQFAGGPIFEKYKTFAIYESSQLSSSEFVENSTVGLIGEIGLQGYIVYMLIYAYLLRRTLMLIKVKRKLTGKADALASAILFSGILFAVFALLRNVLEMYTLSLFFVALMEIGLKHGQMEIKHIIDERLSPTEPEGELQVQQGAERK